jgi:hypothetical protein
MAGRREIPAAPFPSDARTCPAAASGSDEEGEEGRRGGGGGAALLFTYMRT